MKWLIGVIGGLAVMCVSSMPLVAQNAPRANSAGAATKYRVNYRPSATAPWQMYAQTRGQS